MIYSKFTEASFIVSNLFPIKFIMNLLRRRSFRNWQTMRLVLLNESSFSKILIICQSLYSVSQSFLRRYIRLHTKSGPRTPGERWLCSTCKYVDVDDHCSISFTPQNSNAIPRTENAARKEI